MMDQNQINFTPRAQKIVKDAKQEAFKLNKKAAGLEHLFLAFLSIKNSSVINDIFEELEIEKDQLKEIASDCLKKGKTKLKSQEQPQRWSRFYKRKPPQKTKTPRPSSNRIALIVFLMDQQGS